MGLGWEGVRGETGYRVLFYLFTPRPSVARPALVLHVAQTLALRRCINHHAALHPRVKVAFCLLFMLFTLLTYLNYTPRTPTAHSQTATLCETT